MRNIKINNKQKMLWSLIKFSQLIDISMGNLHVDIGTERVLRLCKCLSTNKAKVNLSYSHYFRHRSCFVTKFLNVSLRSGSLFREKNTEERKGKVSFPLVQRPVHRLSECRTYIFHLTIIVQLIKQFISYCNFYSPNYRR